MNNYQIILSKCKKHDRRAQLEFYMLFYKSVYNSCFRILRNPQEAEEVMQETFLKVFDKIGEYDVDAGSMEHILKRIAINEAIDIYRKRRVQFIGLEDRAEELIEAWDDSTEIQLQMIAETMKLLPEGYRIILNLHLVEGLKYEEIAETLQITASTVRSQFTRARHKLIELIKAHYNYE